MADPRSLALAAATAARIRRAYPRALALGAIFSFLSCTLPEKSTAPARVTAPAPAMHVAASIDDDGPALRALEKQLSTVRSDRVIVATRLLRALVEGERARQEKCQTLNEQLNAIKTIDLEETRPPR